MKKLVLNTLLIATLVSFGASRAFADEEKTFTGEAKCNKCVDKTGDTCQLVLKAKDGDKTVTYYLADNDVSKAFHDKVSTKAAKVTATGTVKEVAGKQELTASKLELVTEGKPQE